MCGRYTQTKRADDMKAQIEFVGDETLLVPRYNVAPTQQAAVLLAGRELRALRWGLVPFWAKDESIGLKMINARSETLADKPSFKRLLERHRCLVLADGFYEWRRAGTRKVPVRFTLRGERAFAFAGLWDKWGKGGEGTLETFTIITTEANELVSSVHDRMPVMLAPEQFDLWLDPDCTQPAGVLPLLKPFQAKAMQARDANPILNSPKVDSPECLVPPGQGQEQMGLGLS